MLDAQILVVDDEQSITSVISRILKNANIKSLTASSGAEAVDIFKKQGADIVITDILMPGMSGLELIEKIKGISPDVPVIVLTAHGNYHVAVEALNRGAFYFLNKPFQRESLLSVVNKAMSMIKLYNENMHVIPHSDHSLNYRIPSDLKMVPGIAYQLSLACEAMRFPKRVAHFAVPLAVNELVINAIMHGNKGNAEKKVTVDAEVTGQSFKMAVEDEGEGFDQSIIDVCFTEESLLQETGRGIIMVRHYMDELEFEKNGARAVCRLKVSGEGLS